MKNMQMKPVRALAAVLLLVLVCLVIFTLQDATEVTASAATEPEPVPRETGALRIAVASDLHLDPNNTDKSKGASGEVYNPELVDALLWDVKQQGAEILLLTGDLVNGGKLHRHTMLTEMLRKAEDEGVELYVLPGNHDLSPVMQSEYPVLYEAFGYGEAFSRDATSLSYCVIRDKLMLLMMDTAGYDASAFDLPGASPVGRNSAFISEDTLVWAEDMLKLAREQGLHVIAAGHYNLLSASSREAGGFYLLNGDRFADLLRQYSVPLYLSGHIHTIAVYQEEGLTELVTEYLLSYPTGYSILDLTEEKLRYRPRRIDVDAWAADNGIEDPVLLHHAAWQEEAMRTYGRSVVESMAVDGLDDREKQAASEFFTRVMEAYWEGEIPAKRQELEAMPGYGPFFLCADGYSYGWWLKGLLENSSPLTAGFELTW